MGAGSEGRGGSSALRPCCWAEAEGRPTGRPATTMAVVATSATIRRLRIALLWPPVNSQASPGPIREVDTMAPFTPPAADVRCALWCRRTTPRQKAKATAWTSPTRGCCCLWSELRIRRDMRRQFATTLERRDVGSHWDRPLVHACRCAPGRPDHVAAVLVAHARCCRCSGCDLRFLGRSAGHAGSLLGPPGTLNLDREGDGLWLLWIPALALFVVVIAGATWLGAKGGERLQIWLRAVGPTLASTVGPIGLDTLSRATKRK